MHNIFDTHAHYSSHQFDADRAELLAALPEGGVTGVLECATHSGDAPLVLELAHTVPYFHAALASTPKASSRRTPPPSRSTMATGGPNSTRCARCLRIRPW